MPKTSTGFPAGCDALMKSTARFKRAGLLLSFSTFQLAKMKLMAGSLLPVDFNLRFARIHVRHTTSAHLWWELRRELPGRPLDRASHRAPRAPAALRSPADAG